MKYDLIMNNKEVLTMKATLLNGLFGAAAILASTFAEARSISPFSLTNMNASPRAAYSSAEHPYAVFVIESYFLDCPYCNDNASNVHDLAEEFADESRVQVLDVGIDTQDVKYDRWIQRHQPKHPVLKDASRVLTRELGTTSYPSAYVVDCNGEIVYSTRGVWTQSAKAQIRQIINDRLALNTCGAPSEDDDTPADDIVPVPAP
jgi:peroxiredoxin